MVLLLLRAMIGVVDGVDDDNDSKARAILSVETKPLVLLLLMMIGSVAAADIVGGVDDDDDNDNDNNDEMD